MRSLFCSILHKNYRELIDILEEVWNNYEVVGLTSQSIVRGGIFVLQKGRLVFVILFVFLLAVGVTGCGKKEANNAQGDTVAIAVETAKVQEGSIAVGITQNGTVNAEEDAAISAKVAAQVIAVPVKLGDPVKKGQTLIELDMKDLEAQLRQAQAGLELAKANLGKLQANLDNAATNLERMQKLYEEGAISKSQLEGAQLQHTAALEDLKSLNAQVKQAEATVALVQSQVDGGRISSPIDGVVASINIGVGEMVSPGMPVASVVKMDNVIIKTNLSEQNIGAIKKGSEVKVKIDALPGREFTGKVQAVSPASNPQTKSYPVEVIVENKEGIILPGMFARVDFITTTKEKVLKIPFAAVVEKGLDKGVYVIADKKAVFRKIQTGLTDGETIEVVNGLKKGEEIVVKEQTLLEDGSVVQIQNRGE